MKPNENSFSTQVVSNTLLNQIKNSGLVEFARVRKYNLSLKLDFFYLLNRFSKLASSYNIKSGDKAHARESVIKLLQLSDIRQFRIGSTRVIFSIYINKKLKKISRILIMFRFFFVMMIWMC